MQVGSLDIFDSQGLAGWHISSKKIAEVDVYQNGKFFCTLTCNQFRADLPAIIKADGIAGFSLDYAFNFYDLIEVYCHESQVLLNAGRRYLKPNHLIAFSSLLQKPIAHNEVFQKLVSWLGENTIQDKTVSLIFNNNPKLIGLILGNRHGEVSTVIVRKSLQEFKAVRYSNNSLLPTLHIKNMAIRRYTLNGDEVYLECDFIDGRSLTFKDIIKFYRNGNFDEFTDLINDVVKLNSSPESLHKDSSRVSSKISLLSAFSWWQLKTMYLVFKKIFFKDFKQALLLYGLIVKMGFGKKVFSHGDLYAGNVMVTQTGLQIIDWDKYGYYPVGYDFATLFRSFELERSPTLIENLLHDYANKIALTPVETKKLMFNFWSFAYVRYALEINGFSDHNFASFIKGKMREQG